MKSLIVAIVFSLTAVTPLVSYAGPGDSCHFHGSKPAAEATISQCANQRKDAFVKNGKLEKSWSPIKQESVEFVDGKKGKEWKVIFINPSASDQNKKNLLVALFKTFKIEYLGILIMGLVTTLIDVLTPFLVQ